VTPIAGCFERASSPNKCRTWSSLCGMSTPYASVSIVCVYNDPAVRQQCLDRSIQTLSNEASDVEYLPIENENGDYPSAGAALNHGVSLATNDVIVFVHQDVFLHSLTALKRAAGQMQAGGFGLLGANGMHADGRLLGRVRDRVVLSGETVDQPTDVDSVDELLFMAPRSQLLNEPLTESGDMAWHAYAVEYGLRVRRRGLRTGVAEIPLTHNSLTANLARLDDAHQAVAARYKDLLPIRTTCGTVTSKTAQAGGHVWFPAHRWRYRWLVDSISLQGARKAADRIPAVLVDIRDDVDEVIDRSPGRRLHIVNCSNDLRFVNDDLDPLELRRRDGTVVFSDCGISDTPATIASRPSGSWLMLTNLSQQDIKILYPQLAETPSALGFNAVGGFWLLFGAAFTDLPSRWHSKRATPLGMRVLPQAEPHNV
jgi:Glycosyltransferase like family